MESSTKRVNTSREFINILYIISLKLVTQAKGMDMVYIVRCSRDFREVSLFLKTIILNRR